MRPPTLVVAAAALAVPLLAGVTPGTEAATEVRHYLDADQVGGAGADEHAAVDGGRDLVATAGSTSGALPGHTGAGGSDAFVRVVDRGLGEVWTSQLGTDAADLGSAVATDGRTVVAGGATEGSLTGPSHGSQDGWVRVFEADGSILWSLQIGGPLSDAVRDVEVSGDAVYVSGYVGDSGFVRRYSLAGDLVWEGDVSVAGVHHLLLRQDRLHFVQWHTDDLYPPTSIATIRTATGARTWQTRRFGFQAGALATDGERLYLAGWYYGNSLRAFSLEGRRLWSTGFPGGRPMGADWDGTALVMVTSKLFFGDVIEGMAAVSPTGRLRWARPTPAGFHGSDATYHRGAFYVAGSTDRALSGPVAGRTDAVVARFVTYQPDAQARVPGQSAVGRNWYGARHQRLVIEIPRGRTRRAELIAQNDGEVEQTLLLGGCRSHDGYRIRYLNGSEDVSSAVGSTGLPIDELRPGDAGVIDVAVSRRSRSRAETTCAVTVTSPTTDEVDRVTLVLRRR